MKTACTAFIMILLVTSCAKKFSKEESLQADNTQFVISDEYQVLKGSTNTRNLLTFSDEHDFVIPSFIDIELGLATNHSAKLYFDYSDQSEKYAYFCRYFPSEDLRSLNFDNCFSNELAEIQYDSVPSAQTQLVFYPGYIDLVSSGNSIVLEILNNQDQSTINAQVQIEID